MRRADATELDAVACGVGAVQQDTSASTAFEFAQRLAGLHSALPHHDDKPHEPACASVLDLCSGSGNLALALAYHAPRSQVWAGDVCGSAVALAERNAQQLGLNHRVAFRVGDLFAPFQEPCFTGQVDLLVCNPPYISSGKVDTLPPEIQAHEPRAAFDGGPLGVQVLWRVLRDAPLFLRPGGWLAVEVGCGQGESAWLRVRKQAFFDAPHSVRDRRGDVRVVMVQRASL